MSDESENQDGNPWLAEGEAPWRELMNRAQYFILDEHDLPVTVTDPEPHLTWERWKHCNRHRLGVSSTRLPDGTWISTIFLGRDMNWGLREEPAIYETMVFGPDCIDADGSAPPWHHIIARYATPYQARTGHVVMVKLVKEMQQKTDDETIAG